MNVMKEFVKPTLVLAIICLVITACLSLTYEVTKPIIEENDRKIAEAGRIEVLPAADGFDQVEADFPAGVVDVYTASNHTGYVVTVTSKGYSSNPLKVMVGINNEGTIENVKVLTNEETPGLGSKVSNADFLAQFPGMNESIEGFEAIGGATISSNAMRHAMELAFEAYNMVKGA